MAEGPHGLCLAAQERMHPNHDPNPIIKKKREAVLEATEDFRNNVIVPERLKILPKHNASGD